MLTLGIDVGGSKLLALLVDEAGHVVDETRLTTGRSTAPDAIVRTIADEVRRHRAQGRAPAAVGVGIPGLCDFTRGLVRSSIMLDGWHEVALAAAVTRATELPCAVDNDVNMAAACEAELRALDGECMLFAAIGTGIGGAITFGRQLWRGASGVAGELGNVVIERHGPRCWCGRRGCLNTRGSGSAIEAAADITPGTLATAVAAGYPAAQRAVADAANALAVALGNVVNLLNPSLIVLGGGVAELGPAWLAAVRAELATQAFPEALAACRVELAQSGYAAGARGAAAIARGLVVTRAIVVEGVARVA